MEWQVMRRLDVPELLSRLREILADADKELASLAPDDLPSTRQTAALERWLQLSIQIPLDLGDRLLAARGFEEPPRYRDIFDVLQRSNIIPSVLARRMESLADLRNALVHEYGEFGPGTTPTHARSALPALREYAALLRSAFDQPPPTTT